MKTGKEKALHYIIDEYGGLLQMIVRKHLYSLPARQEECLNEITSLEDNDVLLSSVSLSTSQNELQREFSDSLEWMLECLKPDDRKLFLYLFYDEMDLDEISAATGIKKEVLYNRISRGKKRIRKHYENKKGATL